MPKGPDKLPLNEQRPQKPDMDPSLERPGAGDVEIAEGNTETLAKDVAESDIPEKQKARVAQLGKGGLASLGRMLGNEALQRHSLAREARVEAVRSGRVIKETERILGQAQGSHKDSEALVSKYEKQRDAENAQLEIIKDLYAGEDPSMDAAREKHTASIEERKKYAEDQLAKAQEAVSRSQSTISKLEQRLEGQRAKREAQKQQYLEAVEPHVDRLSEQLDGIQILFSGAKASYTNYGAKLDSAKEKATKAGVLGSPEILAATKDFENRRARLEKQMQALEPRVRKLEGKVGEWKALKEGIEASFDN